MNKNWSLGLLICALGLPRCLWGLPSTNAGGKIQFADPVVDFGKIRSGEIVKHTFVFTNLGPEVLNINSVQPSCGCTAAAEWTRVVPPGQTGSIPIQFNSASFNGQVSKTISVHSSDKSQPSTILQLKANIWRPVDVSPAFAVINVPPDNEGHGSTVVSIVNNTDQPLSFSEPQVNNRFFTARLEPDATNSKLAKLIVSTVPPISGGNIQCEITIRTTSPEVPSISARVWANVQPPFVVLPAQMTLPAPPLANAITPSVLVVNNSTNALKITDPAINVEDVGINIRETQPGKQFSIALTFPAGFEVKPNQQVVFTAKSSHPGVSEIRVPIAQMSRPITIPPAVVPAPAEARAPAVSPHLLPAVTTQ